MQTHLGTDPRQGFHLEVRCTHPALDGAERMFNSRASHAHAVRLFIEARLGTIQNVRMHPATDTDLI